MDDCIFCKIVSGEIPSTKIYEDDTVLAFLDISQTTRGHTLLIPKKHYRNILAMTNEEAAALFSKTPALANQLVNALKADGINIILNSEKIAGQTVFHTHIHLLPRYSDDEGPDFLHTPQHDYDLAAIARQIRGE